MDDELIRQQAILLQKMENISEAIAANARVTQDVQGNIAELRGDLALVLTWTRDNKKKFPIPQRLLMTPSSPSLPG